MAKQIPVALAISRNIQQQITFSCSRRTSIVGVTLKQNNLSLSPRLVANSLIGGLGRSIHSCPVRNNSCRNLSNGFSYHPIQIQPPLFVVEMPGLTERTHIFRKQFIINHNSRICAFIGFGQDGNLRCFSTSSKCAERSKGPFETSQPYLGSSSKNSKRKRSSIGQTSNHAINYIDNKKTQLNETKVKITKGVKSIQSSFEAQNKRLHENLKDQQTKQRLLVRRLKKRLEKQTKRENIKTIPNLLTTMRMASAPLLSYLVINDHFGYALTIFVLAGLTDMLDGYIARNFKNQRTAFGTALDPLADKLLISFLTVSLTVNGLIPVPVTALILARDAGLVVASFYIRYISLAPPRTLSRYFDFSHVTAKVHPSTISKVNTGLQLSFVACTLAAPVFDFVGSPWLQLLMYTTAATTFLSGADYMLTWRRRLKIIKNN